MTPAPPIPIVVGDEADRAAAEDIAARFGLPIAASSDAPLVLAFASGTLELTEPGRRPGTGVSVDAASIDLRRGGGNLSRRQPLARAIGRDSRRVVDATGGTGHDAMLLAAMGYEVVVIERSPAVAALLFDGHRRSLAHPVTAEAVGERLEVVHADARAHLATIEPVPDAIYVDPMFPPRRKRSARARKSVEWLRVIVGDDPDAAEIVLAAQARGVPRIVVKRPDEAPPLAGEPAIVFAGKLVRYDVYLAT